LSESSANNNWAGRNGHLEVVRLLLQDPRVNPAVMNNWAIQGASRNGHTEVVRLLATAQGFEPQRTILLAISKELSEVVNSTAKGRPCFSSRFSY